MVNLPTQRLILVTGGAGFIGSHLVECLLERGQAVRVLDNFSTGKRENLEYVGKLQGTPPNLELIEGDIRDYPVCRKACQGADAILHQAALGSVPRSVEDPMATQQVNADGTLNVFLAAKECGVARVAYASSSSVYGGSPARVKKEGEEGAPLSPYALTKNINEEYGRLFGELYGVRTVGLRYFNVYGPRQDPNSQYAAVIPRFISALLSGSRPTVYGTGLQSRDFTFVRDVVQANLLALEAPPAACGRAYNVGRGASFTVLELLAALQKLMGTGVEPVHEAPRPGDVMHSSADVSLAAAVLGYRPQYDLLEGLEPTIQWHRSQSGLT